MSDLSFAEPGWVHGLWAVLALAVVLALSERRAARALERLVAPALRARLVHRATPAQRRARNALLCLSALCGVLALMRPQWGLEFVETPRASAELMVAIDVSRSMLAEDVVPNRLERAKAEVRDLLGMLEGDHVGLIAFAGRASVLAPLTPDFGFFRLVLDELGPHSVSRGGTRLEEPIRKALAGFRATGDVSRAILLITDGEDHDSFPLDAAREAAERGIAVIAIGLGSAGGVEIPVTEPGTGARELVRDAEGRAVRSRLDEETLREIARVTGGAYVPAGTGMLDLESIYSAHLAGLMRGQHAGAGRPLRTEGFQWLVLASLLSLVGAVALGHARGLAAAGLLAVALLSPHGAAAQGDAESVPAQTSVERGEPAPEPEPTADAESQAAPDDPREAVNLALEELQAGELDAAGHLFELARASAGTDGEARYRATYGLGWVEVASADAGLEGEPEEALAELRLAADRFRAALQLRPGSEDARHNLEVVLRRARVLEDALRERDNSTIADEIDALARRQRELVGAVRAGFPEAQVARGESDELRARLRQLSSQQRTILSDGDALAARVDAERSELASQPSEELTPEQQLREAQLTQVLPHLHRARERMGHARRELRQRRGARAHRRAAVAVDELERARDQLRDPVQVLDALIRDASEVAGYTRLYAASALPIGAQGAAPERPDWLSADYLGDALGSAGERTGELTTRLSGGLRQVASAGLDPAQRRLVDALQQAVPLVGAAAERLELARRAIGRDAALEALATEADALAALAAARELFLDLRGLIETAYADQQALTAWLGGGERRAEARPAPLQLGALQQRNRGRVGRIAGLLDEELDALAPEASDEAAEVERRRLLLAKRFATLGQAAMGEVASRLVRPGADLEAAARPSARAARALGELRRLFFSTVEQLRDTARRQLELNDATERALGLEEPGRALGPLVPRQAELAHAAGQIAAALDEQSRQGSGSDAAPDAAEASDRLRRAAELTLAAQPPLQAAAEQLAGRELEPARVKQDTALGHLLEAVALLTPPEAAGDRQQRKQAPQDEAREGREDGSPEQQGTEAVDPSQLLQEVRDREAERRRARSRERQASTETVEKDW